MYKNIFLFAIAVICIAGVSYGQEVPEFTAFKKGSEPEGFRGIQWDTDIKSIKDKKGLIFQGVQGPLETFTIKNDNLTIGDADLAMIGYSFWMGKFAKVDIIVKGSVNYKKLRENVFNIFGTAQRATSHNKALYFWRGEKTMMSLGFIEEQQTGMLILFSKDKYDDIEES